MNALPGERPTLLLLRSEDVMLDQKQNLAEYTYGMGGTLSRKPYGLREEGETFDGALLRLGFSATPDLILGGDGYFVRGRIHGRDINGHDDYLVVIEFPRRLGPVVYIPGLPELWDLQTCLPSVFGG